MTDQESKEMTSGQPLITEPVGNVIPVTESAAIMQVIERAALNPDVDVDKMERLFEMHQKITAKTSEEAFNEAMSKAQSKMGRISADCTNPQTKSNYASYAALDRVLRPIYTENGFALSFGTDEGAAQDFVRVTCHVSHSDGHSRKHYIDMSADGKGAKGGNVMTQTHATGAAMTYGMRYLLKLIFNVAIGEDENDGNEPVEKITEIQANELYALINENELPMKQYERWLKDALKVNSIEEISINALPEAKRQIDMGIKAKKKAKK